MKAALVCFIWLFALPLFTCEPVRITLPNDFEDDSSTDDSITEVDPELVLHKLTQEQVTDWPHEEPQYLPERKPSRPSNDSAGETRVFEGTAASTGQFPYVVFLKSTMIDEGITVNCGGALLSDNYVVTAAQCVASAVSITVVAGTLDPKDSNAQTSPGIATIHPGFRKNFVVNDIALVKLLVPFTLGVNIYPVKLTKPSNPNVLDLATVRIYGWGSADGTIGNALNYVELVQLTKTSCHAQTIDYWIEYPATASCISSTANTNGFCKGDIGGPVTFTYPGEAATSLVGVLSQFQSCPSRYPMSYTRIGPYIGWIKSFIKNLLKT